MKLKTKFESEGGDVGESTKFLLIGSSVKAAYFNGKEVILHTDRGVYELCPEGECCSHTWFEHVSGVDCLLGATITGIEEPPVWEEGTVISEDEDQKVMKYSFLLRTSKGRFELEYRNASNGYYGGFIDVKLRRSRYETADPSRDGVPLRDF